MEEKTAFLEKVGQSYDDLGDLLDSLSTDAGFAGMSTDEEYKRDAIALSRGF